MFAEASAEWHKRCPRAPGSAREEASRRAETKTKRDGGEGEGEGERERDRAGSCKHAVVSHGGKYKREVGALKHSNDKQQGVAFPSATVVRASANGVCAAAPLMSDRRTSVCPLGPPPGNGCRRPARANTAKSDSLSFPNPRLLSKLLTRFPPEATKNSGFQPSY